MALYVIRHGETAWSLTGQHTGRTDLQLTAHGEAQALALTPWLRRIVFSRVLTSPRQRARRTCALAGQADSSIAEPLLAEWDYGDYEGLRSADIAATRPGWNVFADGCPGGETPGDVSQRADRLIESLAMIEGDIALFGHGQFSVVLAARWIGLAVHQAQHLTLGPATLSILGHRAGYEQTRSITLWNADPSLLQAKA